MSTEGMFFKKSTEALPLPLLAQVVVGGGGGQRCAAACLANRFLSR